MRVLQRGEGPDALSKLVAKGPAAPLPTIDSKCTDPPTRPGRPGPGRQGSDTPGQGNTLCQGNGTAILN
ncbi:MAG: hypothetical protein WKG07_29430 [Hymenobacter sp.]